MQIEAGILFGVSAALGAGVRTFMGYRKAVKAEGVKFDVIQAISEALPAAALGFIAGATIEPLPEFLSVDGIVLAITMMFGGAGAASMTNRTLKAANANPKS